MQMMPNCWWHKIDICLSEQLGLMTLVLKWYEKPKNLFFSSATCQEA